MPHLRVSITRFISPDQPGFVECKFKDAWNTEFTIVEKVPVITLDDLDEKSQYPQPGAVACELVHTWVDNEGRNLCKVTLEKPYAIETVEGLTQFDVVEDDVIVY